MDPPATIQIRTQFLIRGSEACRLAMMDDRKTSGPEMPSVGGRRCLGSAVSRFDSSLLDLERVEHNTKVTGVQSFIISKDNRGCSATMGNCR